MTKTTLEEKWAEKKQGKLPLEEIYESGKKETDPQTLNPEKITDSVLDQLPSPTGWRIMVLPYQGKKVSDGGIHLVSKALERQQAATVLGLVLKQARSRTTARDSLKQGHGVRKETGYSTRDTQALELTSMVEKSRY